MNKLKIKFSINKKDLNTIYNKHTKLGFKTVLWNILFKNI